MRISNKKIKILVADDHKVLRHGVIDILKCVDNFEIAGEASNGVEALAILEEYSVDVVLLDIEMPVMNGRETLIQIKKLFPSIKVIMFTTHNDSVTKNYYLALGADDYLAKNSDFDIICNGIIKVFNLKEPKSINYSIETKLSGKHLQLALSDIEKRIVILLCESNNNRTISEILNISENTVNTIENPFTQNQKQIHLASW